METAAEISQTNIVLPIEINDIVFFVAEWKHEVVQGKVSMLQQKADGSWKFRISEGGSVFDRPMSDIGRKIFLTYEEAQQYLN